MNESLFLLVNVIIIAISTGAPLANEQNLAPDASHASNAEDMIMVGKRAEEMVYYGNQQNEPRVPMKKSQPLMINPPAALLGEVDQGGRMVAHEEIPVEEDLNDRAEAVRGESDLDRLEEGLKAAGDEVEQAEAAADEAEEEPEVKDEKEVVVVNEDGGDSAADDALEADLPESDESIEDVSEDSPVTDMAQDGDNNEEEDDEDRADEELASLSNEVNTPSENEEGNGDDGDFESTEDDEAVKEFFDDMRQENDDRASNAIAGEDTSSGLKGYKAEPENGAIDPNYYQTLYHILANTYTGADDYYDNNYNMMMSPYYVHRRRRSSLRRRNLGSIRSRRNGHIRRIKRDLPSDWLAAYGGLDLPYSNDLQDSLLSEPEDSYEDEEPINEELSRYIYANLLNKIYGEGLQADVEEEIPYEEILPYELGPEIPEPLLEEKYEPEEILYEPEVYRENPYEEYAPSYGYRKRSGAGYYPDSRRKRYFYPAYEEPETHWGAFVPEKRAGYDDALQRLQKLAFALNDNPRPYYDSLLSEYKKK